MHRGSKVHLASAVCLAFPAAAAACEGIPCLPIGCLMQHALPRAAATGVSGAFPANNVTLFARMPLDQIGGGPGASGSSIYGWVDPLTNREYAIMGRSNGTAFIDVTNPAQPKYVANLPPAAGSTPQLWREPKVYRNHAYIGVDGTNHPMQVVDLTRLRAYAGTPLNLTSDFDYRGPAGSLARIHTLAIDASSGFLYAAGSNTNNGGLHIIDVRNPANPVYAGGVATGSYTHETQVVTYAGPDADYQGRQVAFNSNGVVGQGDRLAILDVTDKARINQLSSRTYAEAGYIHQGWLTEDHRYFFQNDELDELGSLTGGITRTYLWDVSDLDNPVFRGHFALGTTSTDHNLYVKGNYVYETNYTTGLRILEIGDLSSADAGDWLTEVGYFDTYPADDNPTFNGAWNNYPFFPSGNIVVSDIDSGLFILRADFAVPEPGTTALTAVMSLLQCHSRFARSRGRRQRTT
jgi:choice-of-anchor B domain-containing protein